MQINLFSTQSRCFNPLSLLPMSDTFLKIGTRGSALALWQAHFLQDRLKEIGVDSEIKIIKTKGDRIQDIGFDKLEGKGFFTKEIEDELISGAVDLAVHSMKDMPTTSPEGLLLAGVSYREIPTDTLLVKPSSYKADESLRVKPGAIIGTSSARRKAQLQALNPSVEIVDLRGNVPTRVDKLRNGNMDAIILASAGLTRLALDLSEFKVVELHPREFVPAPAQGVLAYQTRIEDLVTRKIVAKISRRDVAERTNVERKVLNMLDGGCQLPLGVYCEKDDMGYFHAHAAMGSESGLKRAQLSQNTTVGMAEELYRQLTKAE